MHFYLLFAFTIVNLKPDHKFAQFPKKWFPMWETTLGKGAFIYFFISILSNTFFTLDIVIASLCYATALPILLLGFKEMKENKAKDAANPNV